MSQIKIINLSFEDEFYILSKWKIIEKYELFYHELAKIDINGG